ncbi:MAG: hypothetical protein Q9227_005063 [Pyrenula ochraceoflavens]
MAVSSFSTTQYTSETFIESAGAVLFDPSPPLSKACLIHHSPKNEWLLAKGRRNLHESRSQAALREVREETGHNCRLLPITLSTRAPGPEEPANVEDQARKYERVREPFMLTVRKLNGEGSEGLKLIWWFLAVVEEEEGEENEKKKGKGEGEFRAEFFKCAEAVERLSFKDDRRVLRRAMELVEGRVRD